MTFGAMFASILAVLAASGAQAEAGAAEALHAIDAADASGAGGAAAGAAQAAGLAGAEPSPPAPVAADPDAFAEAARVVLAAGAAGTPIVIAPAAEPAADAPAGDLSGAAPPPADGAPEGAAAAQEPPPLSAAPAGPPLSDAGPVLLERVEAADGWATERLIEPTGEIVLHTVNAAGTVQVCRTVGSLLALTLIEQRPAAGGEYVHVARDASGALVSYAIGADGEPRAVSLLAPAPR